MIRFVILIFVFVISNLNSKESFFDVSYVNSSYDFSKYSFSYAKFISSSIVLGVGYSGYDLNSNTYNMIKTSFELISGNFSFSIKPFYFLEKYDSKFYGAKTGINFISQAEEKITTYGLLLSYGTEENITKKEILLSNIFIEKNFYDEFFIMFGVGAEILNPGFKGFFDKSELFNSNYFGYIPTYIHSVVNFSFARSFKPDFNSYLYVNFDRINAGIDKMNSYVIGLRTYLEDKENYYIDFSFNFADKKVLFNEKIWKITIGGVF